MKIKELIDQLDAAEAAKQLQIDLLIDQLDAKADKQLQIDLLEKERQLLWNASIELYSLKTKLEDIQKASSKAL